MKNLKRKRKRTRWKATMRVKKQMSKSEIRYLKIHWNTLPKGSVHGYGFIIIAKINLIVFYIEREEFSKKEMTRKLLYPLGIQELLGIIFATNI